MLLVLSPVDSLRGIRLTVIFVDYPRKCHACGNELDRPANIDWQRIISKAQDLGIHVIPAQLCCACFNKLEQGSTVQQIIFSNLAQPFFINIRNILSFYQRVISFYIYQFCDNVETILSLKIAVDLAQSSGKHAITLLKELLPPLTIKNRGYLGNKLIYIVLSREIPRKIPRNIAEDARIYPIVFNLLSELFVMPYYIRKVFRMFQPVVSTTLDLYRRARNNDPVLNYCYNVNTEIQKIIRKIGRIREQIGKYCDKTQAFLEFWMELGCFFDELESIFYDASQLAVIHNLVLAFGARVTDVKFTLRMLEHRVANLIQLETQALRRLRATTRKIVKYIGTREYKVNEPS